MTNGRSKNAGEVQEWILNAKNWLLVMGVLEKLLCTSGSRLHVTFDVLGKPEHPGAVSLMHRAGQLPHSHNDPTRVVHREHNGTTLRIHLRNHHARRQNSRNDRKNRSFRELHPGACAPPEPKREIYYLPHLAVIAPISFGLELFRVRIYDGIMRHSPAHASCERHIA